MFISKIVLPSAFLVVGALGYQLGARQNHQSPVQTVTLEDVQVSQIHPAALYIRTSAGKEQRYLVLDLNRDWADPFRQHPQAHWYLQLAPSPWCPQRYIVQTASTQPEGAGWTQSVVIR